MVLFDEQIRRHVLGKRNERGQFCQIVAAVQKHEKDPYSIADDMLMQILLR
ncbi:MAG TPA: hypothetical protein PKA28_12155 [Methylomusa anaerophila]|uniref:hypothetical protein n=1 Tax=Methylomusa anaerophila TaxID=1930071 RepID=UPI0013150372|nr:hypothetical protein [Methylomusa anaerophila]HML89184.1 hypothetical protein [Methylomusa anaerophila]